MQRKATRQSRAANAQEKAHMAWVKERGQCAACGDVRGVICHHFLGSARKLYAGIERVHVGHWAVIGLCPACDALVTIGSPARLTELWGAQSDMWFKQIEQYPADVPLNVMAAIARWGK